MPQPIERATPARVQRKGPVRPGSLLHRLLTLIARGIAREVCEDARRRGQTSAKADSPESR